jgi:hypothetical protein
MKNATEPTEDATDKPPKLGLQKRITQAMHTKSRRTLIQSFVSNQETTGSDLSKADIVAAANMIASSRNLFFQVDQTKTKVKMPARHFVIVIRQVLMMPQDSSDATGLRVGRVVQGQALEYATEACNASGHCYGQAVDLHGCHANGNCAPAKTAVGARHTWLKQVIAEKLKQAGANGVKEEPPTAEVLLHEFSPLQCRSLFPAVRTEAKDKAAEKMLALADEHSALCKKATCDEKEDERKRELVAQMHAIFDQTSLETESQKNNKKYKGLRLDVFAIDHRGIHLWVDAVCGSSMSTGFLPRALTWANRVLGNLLEPAREQSGKPPLNPKRLQV